MRLPCNNILYNVMLFTNYVCIYFTLLQNKYHYHYHYHSLITALPPTPSLTMPSRTHILDLLILLVTFICIIHLHSSDRRPPIRNTLTLSISHLVSTRKPSHLSAQQPSKTHYTLYISLILIMHDIELNPGPRSPKFPCGICRKAVKSSQCGVACDTCNIWYHNTCMHMSSTTYESLDNIYWHCASCITQFTSSLPNSPTSVNN